VLGSGLRRSSPLDLCAAPVQKDRGMRLSSAAAAQRTPPPPAAHADPPALDDAPLPKSKGDGRAALDRVVELRAVDELADVVDRHGVPCAVAWRGTWRRRMGGLAALAWAV
jgi:hypothetical protein